MKIFLKEGSTVNFNHQNYQIIKILDIETLLGRNADGKIEQIKIKDIKSPAKETQPPKPNQKDLTLIDENKWEIAKKRYKAIKPLLHARRTKTDVQERAESVNVAPITIYRWLNKYESSGDLSSLLPENSDGGKGKGRLNERTEEILQNVLNKYYLNKMRYRPKKIHFELKRLCQKENLPVPHLNTIRNRINHLPEKKIIQYRNGDKKSKEIFEPIKGSIPGADYPLAIVQIDHTKVDIILVDDITRKPIGRPWITVAIDVYSRMIAGFYISFDPPSAVSVGLCVKHSVLQKEDSLSKYNLDYIWPVSGVMEMIHVDNAKEFKSKALEMACEKYGIELKWRPVAQPHYGGHIERLIGTSMANIHELPGTTFSNIQQKGNYDSEKNAAFTIAEFERWLLEWIAGVYHQRMHSSLNMSPLQKYKQGILGTDKSAGAGMPPRINDEETFQIDFLPFSERTIQRYGIAWDNIFYYSDVLRPWINAKDLNKPYKKQKFIVRRDPRDISVIYFYDPQINQYFEIPYRNLTRPPISLWEWKEAKRQLVLEGKKNIDEQLIFTAYENLRSIEKKAVKETKRIRRENQRRRLNKNILPRKSQKETSFDESLFSKKIKPFDEIETINEDNN